MKSNKILFLIAACLMGLAVNPVFSQKVWEKPSKDWSKADTVKILNTSPWAQFFVPSTSDFRQTDRETRQTASSGGSNPGSTALIIGRTPIVIRVFSGAPIRQAMIRLEQIQVGYDKMDDKKRAAFDAASKNIIECPLCKPFIVIGIAKVVDITQGVEEGMFQTTKLEDLKGNVKLINDEGEVRELVQLTPATGANDMAVLFFARKDSKGKDFLTSDNKNFKLTFNGNFLNSQSPYAKLLQSSFEFNTAKMKIGEKIEY